MDKKIIVISIVNFFAGITLSLLFIFLTNPNLNSSNNIVQNKDIPQENINSHQMHQMMNMNDMLKPYSDDLFLELMIIHHQDALNMAENALDNSQDEFIKNLSENIIKLQSEEIKQMEERLKK